jgi:hypothetical protein
MPYQLKVNFRNARRGQEHSIPGLGTYKNGSTYEVSDEEAEAFRTYQRDAGMPDRTLLQAFKGDEAVQVTVKSDGPKEQTPAAARRTVEKPGGQEDLKTQAQRQEEPK